MPKESKYHKYGQKEKRRGRHIGARIPKQLYKQLKVYCVESGKRISEVVKEIVQEYAEEAQARLLSGGEPRDEDLQPFRGRRQSAAFVRAWGIEPELSKRLHVLIAMDGTTISRVVQEGVERLLRGYTPKTLKKPPS